MLLTASLCNPQGTLRVRARSCPESRELNDGQSGREPAPLGARTEAAGGVAIVGGEHRTGIRGQNCKIVLRTTAVSGFAWRRRAFSQFCTAPGRPCLLSSRSRVRVALGTPLRIARSEAISWLLQMIFTRPVSGFVPVACPIASRRPARPGGCCLVSVPLG